eukprot:2382427-Amphidinium_carterae.1
MHTCTTVRSVYRQHIFTRASRSAYMEIAMRSQSVHKMWPLGTLPRSNDKQEEKAPAIHLEEKCTDVP